ncbi:hypothetical protein MKW92_035601 [Papaver armeniacum]|nr:hypothetical protein MKW92_035601 [Papaver armeniacum]
MDIVSPILDIFSRLWTCSAHNTDYVRKLRKNLITLETSFNSLRCQRDDVIRRIDMAEFNPAQPAKRTNVVSDWLQRVQALETENDGGCYFCCWGRRNCLNAFRLGKLVSRKQIFVETLLKERNIQDVTYRCQPNPLQQIPTVELVGMDAKFNEVLESLGLYGIGGVGKTTLLQKVNNEFAKRKQFDLVFFVVVSRDLALKRIQNQIGKKLGVSWTEETNLNERANDIFVLSKNKKFLLLLDDIWEGLDLETIGFSKDTFQVTGSKVVFTTRNKQVCGFMEADKSIKIECLDDDQAWSLFQQKVKQEALSCHPDVPEVAKNIAKECCGLPLALIAIGRTMSSKTDLHQWQHALHTLHESASRFSGMADKVLAILKFSYDNLENQKLKSCFLYCSLYPEDHSVLKYELFAVWIGEGFLDNVDDYVKAQNEGHDVIRCLKDACLLESGIALGVKMEYLVKMHDVVRDLAIWVASDLGRKKNTDLTLQSHSTMDLHEWEKAERISLVGNKSIKILNGAPNCPNITTLFLQNSNITDISDEFFLFMPLLKVLNMYCVNLKKLPTSIFSLWNLRSMYMPEYDEDIVLAPGSVASLTKMKILCLSESCCHWEVEGGPSLDEVESLRHLICLIITVGTGLALQRLVTSAKLQSCTKFLTIKYCPGIASLTFLPSSLRSSLSIVHMCRDEDTLFTALEDLFFNSMPKLRIIWDVPQQSFCSVKLKRVIIRGCPQLKDITWLIYAQNLRELILENLDGLDEIISNGSAAEEKLINTFSKLNYLVLRSLKNLKRVCDQNVKFFLLEKISEVECPALKKLPFNANSVIPRALKIE